jgi:hypothetical protein
MGLSSRAGLARRTMLAIGLLSLIVGGTAQAQTDPLPSAPETALTDLDGWRFHVALYGWAPSVAGSVTACGQTVDVNASFIEILQEGRLAARLHGPLRG